MGTSIEIMNKKYVDEGLALKADKSVTYTKDETDARIQTVVGTAPVALDTLKELADALGDDANYATTMTNQLALKANTKDMNDALALKSDITYVDSADALKANAKDVSDSLTLKADITYVDKADALKANVSDVADSLALKANVKDVSDSLALKADITYVDKADALKADKTYVDSADALKADITYVDKADALKADITYVDNADALKANVKDMNDALALKADKTYVDSADALKANTKDMNDALALKTDKTYVDSADALKANAKDVSDSLALKADITYVDNADALKADKTYVDSGLALKANSKDVSDFLTLKADKTYVDYGLSLKANSADVYTKTETDSRIQTVVGAAPAALDTLKELADALGNDASFASTVTNQLALKANAEDMNDALVLKANVKDVADSLALKADKTYVDSADALKANVKDVYTKTDVDTKIAAIPVVDISGKADITYVDKADALKADITYVDSADALKANVKDVYTKTDVDAKIAAIPVVDISGKADITYVDKADALKANVSDVYTKTETDSRIQSVIGTAPTALDTLKELADAINDDANFAATVTTNLSNKVDKITGKGLSTNDYTTTEKNKLAGIQDNANNYVHPTGDGNLHVPANGTTNSTKVLKAGATAGSYSWANVDWNEVVNKPSVYTPAAHTHAATDISVDSTHEFVTDAQISAWTAKANASDVYTKTAMDASLALKADKTYVDTKIASIPVVDISGKANITDVYTKTETDSRIQSVIGAAPTALDTLKELADALGDDANFASTVTSQLSLKADKASIPTALPANGGNADTVDNYHVNQANTVNTIPVRDTASIIAVNGIQNSDIKLSLGSTNASVIDGDSYDTLGELHSNSSNFSNFLFTNNGQGVNVHTTGLFFQGEKQVIDWGSTGNNNVIPINNGAVNSLLNADMLDGLHAGDFATVSNVYSKTQVDTSLAAKVDNSRIIKGQGTFNSTTGTTINLGQTMADTTYSVSITPTSNPNGYLGEVWVEKTATNFVVKCSGSTTSATFDYLVIV